MTKSQTIKTLDQLTKRLQQRRKELKITQTALAQYCNLSRSGISQIERGEKDIRLSTVLKMAKILGLRIQIQWDE